MNAFTLARGHSNGAPAERRLLVVVPGQPVRAGEMAFQPSGVAGGVCDGVGGLCLGRGRLRGRCRLWRLPPVFWGFVHCFGGPAPLSAGALGWPGVGPFLSGDCGDEFSHWRRGWDSEGARLRGFSMGGPAFGRPGAFVGGGGGPPGRWAGSGARAAASSRASPLRAGAARAISLDAIGFHGSAMPLSAGRGPVSLPACPSSVKMA